MHVQVALFAQRRIRGECTHEGERYVSHTRTRVTSCPRSNTPPCPSTHPPFAVPSKHPPHGAPLPPFRLLAPTTPGLFLGGSSIAPNHPHLPSCLPIPLKTPESSDISLARLSPSGGGGGVGEREPRSSPRFIFIRGFSARFVRAR